MIDKKRRDITLGEMQDECRKHEHGGCNNCTKCDPIIKKICDDLDFKSPCGLDLTDPPRFNEAQMALLRMMMGMGAEYATQQNGSLSFYTAGPMRRAAIIDQRILNDGETVYLAELLGKGQK